jgi:hypothetical protein
VGERKESSGERRGRRFGSGEQRLDPRALDGLPPGVVDRLVVRGQGAVPRGPWE